MSKLFIEDTTLSAIGNAIREKTGSSDKLSPLDMPTAIGSITTGGGGDIEVEPVVLTGNCSYGCAGALSSMFIKLFPDKISTSKITDASYMFYNYTGETIPFDINLEKNIIANIPFSQTFSGAKKLKTVPNITYTGTNYSSSSLLFASCYLLEDFPYIYNFYPDSLSGMFEHCHSLREFPEDYFDTWNFGRITSYQYCNSSGIFSSCYSLRKFPEKLLKKLGEDTSNKAYYYLFYNGLINSCHSMDEIIDIPVISKITSSNSFSNSFYQTYRLRKATFKTNEDGTPIVINWAGQTLDFSLYVGYANLYSYTQMLDYNSGITADKEIIDDATYQALKNDPDAWTKKIEYSRYNHDSAVETINSLPNTSATGINTIKFLGASGSLTDGGAISNLTEEEIAVAAAKGWTVSLK